MACEKTINFLLLKRGPFCDPEAAPYTPGSSPWTPARPCPWQLPSSALPHAPKSPGRPLLMPREALRIKKPLGLMRGGP